MVKAKEGEAPPEDETPPKETTPPGDEVTIDAEALKAAIKDVLPDVLKGAGNADPPAGDPPAAPAGGGTLRAQEASVEQLVRSELERTTKEKERDERLSKVEKAIEKAPATVRRLTKWMWGKDE